MSQLDSWWRGCADTGIASTTLHLPDGKGLVSGSLDRILKFWDLSGMGAVAKGKSDGKRDDKSSPCTMNFTGHKVYFLFTFSIGTDDHV